MAADILLYQTDVVPVGEDQQQHIELTRSLAKRFNNKYGKTFKIPAGFIPEDTARIMGLDDATKKMSKSASSANNYIALLDTPDEILRKIKIAVTDSGKEIAYDAEEKPAIANLMRIFGAFADISTQDVEDRYRGKTYADFKRDLGDLLVEKLSPLQTRYRELSTDPDSVMKILRDGAGRAHEVAAKTLQNVHEKIGFVR
jgi:tryptophanyl-tRNA synthetase